MLLKICVMKIHVDDELDMFGDGFDSGKSVQSNDALEDSETMWEYKVGKEGKLTGPLKTSAMIKVQGVTHKRVANAWFS